MPLHKHTWSSLGLGIGLVALVGCSGNKDGPGYETQAATQGALVMEVTAVGTLQPMESVDIGSDLTGQVSEVLVEPNDEVEAGQVLAHLEPRPFQIVVSESKAAVASAKAAIKQAQVNLEKATTDLARTKRLVEQGAATQVEMLNASTQVELFKAQLSSSKAQLLQAQAGYARAMENLDDTTITSPIQGVVLQRQVEPGQTVVSSMSATTLFTVASDLKRMKAEVDIDEADVARLAPGQTAIFTVSAWSDRSFEAEVARVDLSPDPTSAVVVYVAELHLDNPDLALRPGMTATATIETGRLEDGLLVPSAALRFLPEGASKSGTQVWILEGGKPVAVNVELLGSDGMHSAVSGIEAGTEVITGVL